MSEATGNPRAIEFLYELSLTSRQFKEIPEDQRAALGLVAFALTEINCLAKAYIFFDHDPTGNDIVDAAIVSQKHAMLRCWSAKILDLSKLFTEENKRNATDDETLKELFTSARDSFSKLKELEAYKLVKILRNEATSHYYLEPARRNLAHLSDRSNLSVHIHKMNGNSFAPLGEELMFMARISQAAGSDTTIQDKLDFAASWMDWNLEASDWCRETHDMFIKKIIIDRFPDKKLLRRDHWIDPKLAGRRSEILTPIFFRKDD